MTVNATKSEYGRDARVRRSIAAGAVLAFAVAAGVLGGRWSRADAATLAPGGLEVTVLDVRSAAVPCAR